MAAAPVPAVCVGRSTELEWLDRHLDGAVGGAGRVVLVSAEAGAGKSTLSSAFLDAVAVRHPEVRVIRATCSEQYGGGEPYQPFVEAFRTLLAPADDEPRRRRSFREVAQELAPHWVAAIPLAGEVLAAGMATAGEIRRTFGDRDAGGQAPSEEALFFQYTKLFFAAAEQQPILLFIDDLHWADRASVSLLLHLGRLLGEAPVLILGTMRPVDVRVSDHPLQDAKLELERYGRLEELELTPLDPAHLAELAESVLGGPAEPDLLAWLERRAGTNALFFGELLQWLLHGGYAEERHGRWRLAGVPEELSIPRSAESTIEKRLARLDEDTYRVLEYAAVQGTEFMSTTLARLLDMDELDLEERLEPIERAHRLIRLTETVDLPDGDFASLYRFSHSLIQEVLHRSLKGKRRILLHRKMAGMLEELHAADLAPVAHKLAVHCDEGRLGDKAFDYAMAAADRASHVYAHWDAMEFLLRAERNAPDDGRRARALERIGEIQWVVGRLPQALETMQRAQALVHAGGGGTRALTLKRKILLLERDQGRRPPREIADLLQRNADAARQVGATEELCETLWHLVELKETDHVMDVELATEALGLAATLDSPRLQAKGHIALGVALMQGGSPEDARPQLEEALRRYQELEDLAGVGRSCNCLAVSALLLGRTGEALEAFEQARSAFERVGEPLTTALVLNNMGALMIRTGQLDRAEALLLEAMDVWKRLDARAEYLSPLQNLAELAELRDLHDQAENRWRTLRDQAFRMGSVDGGVIGECGLGRVRLQQGDVAGAREQLRIARGRLDERSTWSEAAEAVHRLAAGVAAAEGNPDEAVRLLEQVEAALESRDRYIWAVACLERAGVLRGADRADEAVKAAEAALAVFSELGAELLAERARELVESGGKAAWTDRSRIAS
jgi:tetratricopeptide (TPR) repeat protein